MRGDDMFRKMLATALLTVTLVSILFPLSVLGDLATVTVQPYMSTVWGTGKTFVVNVTVTGVMNLYAVEIKLYYDASILNCTGVSEGPFLKSAGGTYFDYAANDSFDATHGRVRAFDTLMGQVPGVNGSGTVFTVTFETKNVGISALDLEDIILADINSNRIPNVSVSGGVEVVWAVHDVAILGVSVSSNVAVSGQILLINAVASNLGNETETFNVIAYCNDTVVDEEVVDGLSPQANVSVVLLWDTSAIVPSASCTVWVEASQVPDEVNVGNNVLVYGTVTIVQGVHDIAVTSVQPSANAVYQGEVVNIHVTLANKGNYTETFNVTVYRDSFVIGVQVANVTYGGVGGVDFAWNTQGVDSNRTYVIRAVAAAVVGETNLGDNSLTDGNVTVYSKASLSIRIVEVVPCDQSGQPVSGFVLGSVANFRVTLNCSMFGVKSVLLTVNLFDANGIAIGVVSFQGPVTSGVTTFVLGLPVPRTAVVGNARVYADVLSDWPHLGGTPFSPEVSAAFAVRGS
jgi:hypothetical protein